MRQLTLTDSLLGPLLTADPALPRVTWYGTGGLRMDLSGVTLANWAAKTANLLRDEVGAQGGDAVAIAGPDHWLTPAVILGAWWAGLDVFPLAPAADPASGAPALDSPLTAALVTADLLDDERLADAEVFVLGTDVMGRGVTESGGQLPLGVADFTPSVRIHPDAFRPHGDGEGALAGVAAPELLAAARAVGADREWQGGARVLTTRPFTTAAAIVEGLIAPLALGGSVVAAPAGADLAQIGAAERVTARLSRAAGNPRALPFPLRLWRRVDHPSPRGLIAPDVLPQAL